MAFYDEEEEQEAGGPQQLSAQSGDVGSGGGMGASGAPAGAEAPKAQENFVGISQYLNANKPQSEKLAGQVAGNIEEKAKGFESALGGAKTSFDQQADSQKVVGDDALFGQVKTNAEKLADEQKGSFAKMRDAQYKGPASLEDTDSWAGLQSSLKKAQDAGKAASSEEGRMGLIKEISNNPRQSQGALTFDNLLLQNNPNAAAKLKQAADPISGFGDKINEANLGAASKAKDVAGTNQKTREAARGSLAEGYGGLKSSLAEREAAADAEQQTQFQNIQKQLSQGSASNDLLAKLGLTGDMSTYGIKPSDFLNYVDGANTASVAGEDDLARQQVLRELAGGAVDLGNPLIEGELGKLQNPYAFDSSGFGGAVTARETEFQNQVSGIDDQINKLESAPVPAGARTSAQAVANWQEKKQKDLAELRSQRASLEDEFKTNTKVANSRLVPGVANQLVGSQKLGIKPAAAKPKTRSGVMR
jgi:hypothetical protein